MKRTVSTLLFAFSIVAVAAIETEVQEHMQRERVKAARQAAEVRTLDARAATATAALAAAERP